MLLLSIHYFALLLFFVISPTSALNTVNIIPPNISLHTNTTFNYTNASCTSLLTHANATSSINFQSSALGGFYDHVQSPSETFLLTAAVNEVVNNATNSTGVDTTIWFGVHPDRNLTQDGLEFAACAIIIDELPLDSIKRGQADNGSCTQTFSDSCTKALIKRAAEIADDLWKYATPGKYGNRTAGQYSSICDNIGSQLSDKHDVPHECKKFRDEGSEELWFHYETEPITGSQYAPAYHTCSVIDSPAPYVQYPLYNKLTEINNLEDAYINATQAVIPVLILEMPPVNETINGYIFDIEAQLICLHPSNISSGSETPPALPPADSGVLGKHSVKGAVLALLGALGAAMLVVL